MARYFFNVHDGLDLPDKDGTELPSLDAARQHAVRYASNCLMDVHASFWNTGDWWLEVQNEQRLTLFTLHFVASDAPALLRQ